MGTRIRLSIPAKKAASSAGRVAAATPLPVQGSWALWWRTMRTLARTIAGLGHGVPWHLVRFVPEYRLARLPPTPTGLIARAREIGREAGLDFVYTERALGEAGRRTDCPGCGRVLVSRRLWGLEAEQLHGGRCPACDTVIPGRWTPSREVES